MKQLDLNFADSAKKYRWWDILDELPKGWVMDNTAGSPAPMTVFITNGKSPLNGQKRALLKVKPKYTSCKELTNCVPEPKVIVDKPRHCEFPAKTVNDLARSKFKKQILKEILFDLTVCEIEGWDKREDINELKELINEIKI